MAFTNSLRPGLDKPLWRPLNPQPGNTLNPSTGNTQTDFSCDLRGRNYADPNTFAFTGSSTLFYRYNAVTNGWLIGQFSVTLGGTVAGTRTVFVPSQGPSGTISAGATTSSFTLSTALPGAVEINKLANRGDGLGYIVRIVDNAAGASGKIEERRIVANTSGSTPTITVDTPFSFTPTNGSTYEFLSGAIYILTTGASKQWCRHDVLTGVTSAALSTTSLIGTVGVAFNDLVTLDESHVPFNKNPGEGFVIGASTYDATSGWTKGCLSATATAAGTITGQAASGDATVLSNEYRNFQIRIVEDTTTPTAVGQRRRISSHTAGASAVYTLASNWSVTPSATCKFVIENDNDKIIFLTNSTTVYNYNIAANTWDTSTWAVRGTAPTGGTGSAQAFGISDTTKNARNSFIFSNRGVGTGGNPVDVLDISGAATGSWSSFAMTPNYLTQITMSSTSNPSAVYDPRSLSGRYMYFTGMNTSTTTGPIGVFRLDLLTRVFMPYSGIPTSSSGSNSSGPANVLSLYSYIDGSNVVSFLICRKPMTSAGELYDCLLF